VEEGDRERVGGGRLEEETGTVREIWREGNWKLNPLTLLCVGPVLRN
jgi:hypothetical protein